MKTEALEVYASMSTVVKTVDFRKTGSGTSEVLLECEGRREWYRVGDTLSVTLSARFDKNA